MFEKFLEAHAGIGVLNQHFSDEILCLFGDFFGEFEGAIEAFPNFFVS